MIVESISEAMLSVVPTDNRIIIVEYKKSDVNVEGEGSESLHKYFPKKKWKSSKWKEESGPYVSTTKKPKFC